MMSVTSSASVVTKERFSTGLSYPQYLDIAKVSKDKLGADYQLDPVDAAWFKNAVTQPGGPAKALMIVEDWCPDVHRGGPVIRKIAEVSGMDLRLFPRDKHLDIMSEFLLKGEFQAIPVLAFYTQDMQHIGTWFERPALANAEMAKMNALRKEELSQLPDAEFQVEMAKRRAARFTAWQQASVDELRALSGKSIKI